MPTTKSLARRRHAAAMKRQLALLDEWRARPVGTPVTVLRDNGSLFPTTTRSLPELLGDIAVIWVHGIASCYALERVELREDGAK